MSGITVIPAQAAGGSDTDLAPGARKASTTKPEAGAEVIERRL